MRNYSYKSKRGFMLAEVVIASAIITVVTFAIVSAAQKGIILSQRALHETQAGYLLEEGAEATKSIRDSSWTTISNLTPGAIYYLSYSTGASSPAGWSLTTTNPGVLDSRFTRTVVFSDVSRDSNEDIAPSGTVDTHTKKVLVTVSWPYSGVIISKTLTFYIVDIFS
jgi:Tfp pilus assembly protein PilV